MKNVEQDIFNTIVKITSDISDQDTSKKININTRISDVYNLLPLDSLDIVEVIIRLEKHYGISIPDDKIQTEVKTFNNLCNLAAFCINQKKQENSLGYHIKQRFQKTK